MVKKRIVMKKIKKLLIIANIVVFITIYLTINNSDEKKSNEQSLLNDTYSLQEFLINKNDKSIVFKKNNNAWHVEIPFKWKANELAISKIITILSHLKLEKLLSIEEILKRGELLSDYGIDKNSTILSLKNSKTTTNIIIGKKTRDKKFFFTKIQTDGKESQTLWRIPAEVEEISNMRITDCIEEELIKQNIYSIEELSIIFKLSNDKKSETTLQKIDGKWQFIKPFESSANDEKVRLLLNKLVTEKISDINVNGNNNILRDDIRDNWKIKLQITANSDTFIYKFGEGILENNLMNRHCLTENTNHVVQMNGSFIELLSDWSSKLRERKIFKNTSEEINTIEFILPDSNFSISKIDENNWNVVNKNRPTQILPGDNDIINDFVTMLNGLEIKEFLSVNSINNNNESFKNNTYQFKLIISMHDTTKRTFIFSKSDKDASLWKTLIKEDSLLCLLEKNWDEIFSKNIYDYKNRKLFTKNTRLNLMQFNSIDENKTLSKFNDKTHQMVNGIINELKVRKYINNKSKKEGTWNGGDWVPWIYELTLSSSSIPHTKFLRFSNSINDTYFLGNMSDNNLTFELPTSNVQTILNSFNN